MTRADAWKRQQERAQAGAVDGLSEAPWPKHSWPTAEEWLPWFLAQAPDRQASITEDIIRDSQRASECYMLHHEARLADRIEGGA